MDLILWRLIAIGCSVVLVACTGGSSGETPASAAPSRDSPLPPSPPPVTKTEPFRAPLHGQHFPHGSDAVSYLYGPSGMWRELSGVYYGWNFYKFCETPTHMHNPRAMLIDSAVTNSTAPDASCLILGDLNNDGEIIDDPVSGYAFHEHAGRGVRGEQMADPFYQFWFDDNWLVRYVAQAYGQPPPSGLHDFGHSIRWRLIDGDNSYWNAYPSSQHIDQIALNGLFKLNAGDFDSALAEWKTIKSFSRSTYNETDRRFDYALATDAIYHLGLWAILSERLLAARESFSMRDDVMQHAISLHSALLSLQEKDMNGNRLGWRTGRDPRALINTETTSIAVLALAASASWVLEPGHAPLQTAAGNYFLHPDNALSAIAGRSVPGYVVFGPYWTLSPGTYDVDFTLRTPSVRVDAALATLDVYNGANALASTVVDGRAVAPDNQWQRLRLTVEISTDNAANAVEFRVFWHGYHDLDVGAVRVTKRSD